MVTLRAPGSGSQGLDELPLRAPALVKAVAVAGAGLSADRARQLADIGFLPGEVVQVLARAWPGGEPLVVGVGQSRFALRRVEAACVEVLPFSSGGP